MTRAFWTTVGAIALTTSITAQQPTPATQPVRPPDRPPAGEPTPRTLPNPQADDEGVLSGKASPEGGAPDASSLTLRGCLERADAKGYRIRDVKDDDATVTEDVRLEGAVDQLKPLVGRVVEVRGTYQQGTPASTDPFFSVARVREVSGSCTPRPVRP
ncbi:MAG TPA: hypothetical protein VMF13_01190 [Luteitalea sp.]|nr:hypothetical protein [Luteitalea sp.]